MKVVYDAGVVRFKDFGAQISMKCCFSLKIETGKMVVGLGPSNCFYKKNDRKQGVLI